jgi:hypothetical protein
MDSRLAGHTRDFFITKQTETRSVRSCNDVFRLVVLQSGKSRDRWSKCWSALQTFD